MGIRDDHSKGCLPLNLQNHSGLLLSLHALLCCPEELSKGPGQFSISKDLHTAEAEAMLDSHLTFPLFSPLSRSTFIHRVNPYYNYLQFIQSLDVAIIFRNPLIPKESLSLSKLK